MTLCYSDFMSWLKQYLCLYDGEELKDQPLRNKRAYKPRYVEGARRPWNFDKDGKPEFRDLTKIYKRRTSENLNEGILDIGEESNMVFVAEDHPVLELIDMVRTAKGEKLLDLSDQYKRGWYCINREQIRVSMEELAEHWKEYKKSNGLTA